MVSKNTEKMVDCTLKKIFETKSIKDIKNERPISHPRGRFDI